MRALFYTDTQISGQTPQNRKDDYPNSLVEKLREIYQIALMEKVDCLICGGDFFNSHRVFSYDLLSKVMSVVCDCPLTTYMTIGQHDLVGYNKDSFKTSTLAFLVDRCQNIKILWEPERVGDAIIHASHVWEEIMDAGKKPLDKNYANVLVAHHLLTNKKTLFDSISTKDFSASCTNRFDVVLSGDLHDGYDLHEIDGTWFFNPGSIARQAICDRNRPVRVAIFEAKPNKIPIFDMINLKSAKPGREVFLEESISSIINDRDDRKSFVKSLQDFEFASVDVFDMIAKFGKGKVPDSVIDYILRKKETL